MTGPLNTWNSEFETDYSVGEIPGDILQKAMDLGEPPSAAPAQGKAKAARTRAAKAKAGKAKPFNPVASLLAAVKFVGAIQPKSGTPQQTHCVASGNWIVSTNGPLTAACPIEENMGACPHTATFADALAGVEGEVSITQLSETALSVASGDFRAIVPCIPFGQIFVAPPDDPIAKADNRLKEAVVTCMRIPDETSIRPEAAGLLIQAQTVVATNGAVLFEAWHGVDLPPGLLVPKVFATALAKVNKNLTGFGFSPLSVTFWFEDGSFLKTQRFDAQYPAYLHLFDMPGQVYLPVPENFEKAVNFVLRVAENTAVFFKSGYVVSSLTDDTPSQYRTEGLPEGVGFDGRLVKLCLANAASIAFINTRPCPHMFFRSDTVRGVLIGLEQKAPKLYDPEDSGGRSTHGADFEASGSYRDFSKMSRYDDDDIPF